MLNKPFKALASSLIALTMFASSSSADTLIGLEAFEQIITQEESRFADIVQGSEKRIRWYQGEPRQTELAIVYIHGFSASRQELSPTTERLADQLGANAFYARLQGHGRSDDAMGEATVAGWKKNALQALAIGRRIGKRVIIVSTSTGGTLATWLNAQDDGQDILANILISPNYDVASQLAKLVTWPGGLTIARWIEGDYHSFTPLNELHGRYWTNRYPIEAILPMFELLDEVAEIDKSNITTPQLIIYSPNDKVIRVDAIEQVRAQLLSADVQTQLFMNSTDPYQHVLAGDACSPESTDQMVELLSKYIATRLAG